MSLKIRLKKIGNLDIPASDKKLLLENEHEVYNDMIGEDYVMVKWPDFFKLTPEGSQFFKNFNQKPHMGFVRSEGDDWEVILNA